MHPESSIDRHLPVPNAVLTDLAAALGEVQLEQLDGFVERRTEIAGEYLSVAAELGLEAKVPAMGTDATWWRFLVALPSGHDVDAVVAAARAHDVVFARPVTHPPSDEPGAFPVAERMRRTLVSIPIYPSLSDARRRAGERRATYERGAVAGDPSMKILTAHQSVYLPWLGLFHKIAMADEFVYMDDVKHSKSYVINRNVVKHPEARPYRLSVPLVRGRDDSQLISDLEIDNRQRWARKHSDVLRNFYLRAPYFDDHVEVLEFYDKPTTGSASSTSTCCSGSSDVSGSPLRCTAPLTSASTRDSNEYLIELCRRTGCDAYLFGSSGRDYVDPDLWQAAGIATVFQHYEHPEYPQINGPFVSHLATVDLLFNCGPESLSVVLRGNADRAAIEQEAASN